MEGRSAVSNYTPTILKQLDLGPSVISWAIKKNLAFIAN